MTQEYTPVAWQDETTSQQGTLINAERLNQMQTAHHYADGFEEVDAIPTANPGVSYHKIVYCTADSTIYRWDGTEWTADIDDETKRLLEQEIARATTAESTLRGQLEDEHDARVDAEAAINDRITDEATELAQRIATETSTRYTADTALGTRITNETTARETADTGLGNRITAEATARADADTALGGRIDTEQARAEAAEQANAQAIANTYTKAEIDTALALKANQATTYSKTEVQTYVSNALDGYLPMVRTTGNQIVGGIKTSTTYWQTASEYAKGESTRHASNILRSVDKNNSEVSRLIAYFNTDGSTEVGITYQDSTDRTQLESLRYLVHKVGNEIISGVKTFSSSGFTYLNVRSDRTSGNIGGIIFQDGNNVGRGKIYGETTGKIVLEPLGDTRAVIINNQRAYSAGNTTDVATIGTLDAYAPMVRTTGNQPIDGQKTFSALRALTGIDLIDPNDTSNATTPSALTQALLPIRANDFSLNWLFQFIHYSDGSKWIQIQNYAEDGSIQIYRLCGVDANGNKMNPQWLT